MSSYRICAPARIHMNLLALNNFGYRCNGGLGFAITGFDTIVVCQPWHENHVEANSNSIAKDVIGALLIFLENVVSSLNASVPVKITVESCPPAHTGLGSGTSLKLSIVDAVSLVNNLNLNRKEKVRLSRRGGTSGIGVNTYFDGGFVADIGVCNTGVKSAPSSLRESNDFLEPTVIVREKMPSWLIGVFLLDNVSGIAGVKEHQFFADNTPVSQVSVEASTYHAIMGTSSAVIDNNYQVFAESIRNIQTLEWKAAEWSIQSKEVHEAKELLYRAGATSVGLSSFGPALYFTGDKLDLSGLEKVGVLTYSKPNNLGRVISLV